MSTPKREPAQQQDRQAASGGVEEAKVVEGSKPGSTASSPAWLVGSLRVLELGYAVWVVAHLSTIVWGAQDRAQFEAMFTADGARLRAAAALVVGWQALRWAVCLVLPVDRTKRVLATCTLLLWSLHAAGIGMGQAAFGPIEFDAWCAAMSATWFSIPWRAMAYLFALFLTAIEVKQSLSGRAWPFIPTGRLDDPAGLERAGIFRAGIGWLFAIAIGLLGAKGVFALATGSGAIF